MNRFEKYREMLVELHRLTKVECGESSKDIRDYQSNKLRSRMEKVWIKLNSDQRSIIHDIVAELGYRELCMVIFALKEGDQLELHIIDDDKFDDYLVGEPRDKGYHVCELIGYDFFIEGGCYPLEQFREDPRVQKFLQRR